jgi:hypothetical protein
MESEELAYGRSMSFPASSYAHVNAFSSFVTPQTLRFGLTQTDQRSVQRETLEGYPVAGVRRNHVGRTALGVTVLLFKNLFCLICQSYAASARIRDAVRVAYIPSSASQNLR